MACYVATGDSDTGAHLARVWYAHARQDEPEAKGNVRWPSAGMAPDKGDPLREYRPIRSEYTHGRFAKTRESDRPDWILPKENRNVLLSRR